MPLDPEIVLERERGLLKYQLHVRHRSHNPNIPRAPENAVIIKSNYPLELFLLVLLNIAFHLIALLDQEIPKYTQWIGRPGAKIHHQQNFPDYSSPIFTHWSFATAFIPSSRYGTILSFRYSRAGAPPGRTCEEAALESSAIGVWEPLGSPMVLLGTGFCVSLTGAGGLDGCDVASGGCAGGRNVIRRIILVMKKRDQEMGGGGGKVKDWVCLRVLRRAELWSFWKLPRYWE